MLIATGASGWGVMSCALGAWCRNHKVKRGKNQLTMYILTISCPRVHVVCSTGQVSKPQGWTGVKTALQHNFVSLFPDVFWFACNLAWRPDRSVNQSNNTIAKKEPVEGREEGEGGAVSSTYVLRVCQFVYVLLVHKPYMWWHACEILWIWREWKCHRPNPRFSSVFWCFFR